MIHPKSTTISKIDLLTTLRFCRPLRSVAVSRRLCLLACLTLVLLTTLVGVARAQGGSCASCEEDKTWVKVRFYGQLCARYPIDVKVDGNVVTTASGVCTADSWSNTDYVWVLMKPDQNYQFSVGPDNCSVHINFYDIPEEYELEINGVKTTTIDKESVRAYGGQGVWNVRVKKKCPCGEGGPGESAGPELGSVIWNVAMGKLSDGRSAGSISIREDQLSAYVYTPDALIYSPPSRTNEVEITRNSDGSRRQVKAPETLADVVVISPTEYDIRFYRPSDVGAKDADGLYTVSGQPYVTYKIKNPDPATTTKLQILKIQNSTTDTSEYTWDAVSNAWSLSKNSGASIVSKTTTYPTDTSRTETTIIKDSNGQVSSKTARTYHTFAWGEELIKVVVYPSDNSTPQIMSAQTLSAQSVSTQSSTSAEDVPELTTTYAYYESPDDGSRYRRLKSVTNPDGSWEKYDYDGMGNKVLVLRPWKDSSLESATEANSHAIRYTYSNNDGVNLSLYARLVSSVTEKIEGTVVHKTTYARSNTPVNGEPAATETVTAYSAASATQVTSTTTYHQSASDFLADKLAAVLYADGRKDTYTYERGNYVVDADPSLSQFTPNAGGTAIRETVVHGTSASPDGVAYKTTKENTIRDQRGHVVLRESYVYNGAGYERVTWTATDYDDRGHMLQTRSSDGKVSSSTWSGEQKLSDISESGVEITYTYDSTNRVKTQTKKGVAAAGGFPAQPDIVTTYGYDAAGRTTSQRVTAGSLSLIKQTVYDTAGRIKSETDEAGLTTLTSYTNGGRTQTVTLPGGSTQSTDSYLDGQVKSVTGTAVVASYFDYGVNTADGTMFTQEYIGSAGPASPRWTKTTSDWKGRNIKIEKPGFIAGTTLIQTYVYNNKGQLQAEGVTAGTGRLLADKLYEYDELGNQIRAGLDVDANGTLAASSTDRMAETGTVYEKAGGNWFRVTTARTYLRDNDATATSRTQKERLTFPVAGTPQLVAESLMIDEAGNQTSVTTTLERAAKKVTTTTNTPDSATTAISIIVNGLLQSYTPTTPQSATTYSYDALGRTVGVNDPRAGTAAKTYDATTGRLASVSQGGNTTTYEYYPATHQSAGRLKAQTNPAGKKVYFNYNSRGELTQTWGDATYPLESVYDAYGQRTELHTFRNGTGWTLSTWPASATGTADVTRWVYQQATGLLVQNQDAAGKQVTYTYDAAGRLKTRVRARLSDTGGQVQTTYSYDPNSGEGSGIDYSDATPDVTFAYDRGGRQRTVTDAAGMHTLTYNLRGGLQADEIAGGILDGVTVSVGYDSFLRPSSLQASRGTSVYTSQTYGYDASSRLQTVTSGGRTATYAYYPASGLLNTTSYGDGTQLTKSYDALGRLESITTTPANGTAQSYTYTYNNLSQRTRVTREDSSYWSYSYNDRGELVSGKKYWSDNTPVSGKQTEYGYDNLGNRTAAKSGGDAQGAALRQSAYTPNSLNQYAQRSVPGAIDVLGVSAPDATVTVNNQAAERRGSYFSKTLTVDNSAGPVSVPVKVVAVKSNAGANGEDVVGEQQGRIFVPRAQEAYTYDADGNLTSDGRWNYTWDGENRLTSMQALAGVPAEAKRRLEFAYDYMGRRIEKRVYGWDAATSSYQLQSATKFIYDGWNPVAELDGNNNLVRSYVYGFDLLSISGGGNVYYVGHDGNQNVTALVKAATGTIAALYDYDPFGQTIQATGEYASQNPIRFSEKYTDSETGLIYYGYRYYNPQIGRWISRDPSGESGGVNLYGFINNDGVNGVDYLGLWKRDGEWTGGWFRYRGTATADCPGESLSSLAQLITGDGGDYRYLKQVKVYIGTRVDVAPLLKRLESKLRDSVVKATGSFNAASFPRENVLLGPSISAADVNQYFGSVPYGEVDCTVAAWKVLDKGLINVIGGEFFDRLDLPVWYISKEGNISEMLLGDRGNFSNYADFFQYTDITNPWQGENVIKVGRNQYWGFGDEPRVKSAREWELTLQRKFNELGGPQRHGSIPGFSGPTIIQFLDTAKIGMRVFDLRKGGN